MSGKSVNSLVVVKKIRKARKPRVPKEKVLKVKMFKWEELSSLYLALIRAEYKYKEWTPPKSNYPSSVAGQLAQKEADIKLISQLSSSVYTVMHRFKMDKGEATNGNDSEA